MNNAKDIPVDLSYLNEYCDGDADSMKELITVFLETFSEGLAELGEHLSDPDTKGWHETSHKLKGASGFAGALQLMEICAESQRMESTSIHDRKSMLAKILAHFEKTKHFLEKSYA